MREGRREEGLALLRNALVAAELNELDDPRYELDALNSLICVLIKTNSIDEVEPLVLRYREAANAQMVHDGLLTYPALHCVYFAARLHQVPCRHPTFDNPLPRLSNCFQHGHIESSCRWLHRTRETTHAPVEHCALQARGMSQEAAREVRALLDLIRENEPQVQEMAAPCATLLEQARQHLTILDPEVGEEELIQAVAAALGKLMTCISEPF